MRILFIIFILLFHFSTLAQTSLFNKHVQVTKRGSAVYLVGSDCKVLDKEAQALEDWTKSIKEKAQKSSCACQNGVCTKEVTQTIPDFVEAYQFKHVPTDGPNCWNATLVAAKVVPQVRYTSDFEMNFWMNSPLCKEKKDHEPLRPGDVIAIRSSEHLEVHGFIHLSENLSFSKNGFDKSMPYSLQDPNVVFDIYDVPKECRRKYGEATGCRNYANYYSCISMDEYLKKNPIKDNLTKQSYNQLHEIECGLSEAVLNGKSGRELKRLMQTTLEVIRSMSYEILSEKKFHPDDKVVWQALYHKSKSLMDQISLM